MKRIILLTTVVLSFLGMQAQTVSTYIKGDTMNAPTYNLRSTTLKVKDMISTFSPVSITADTKNKMMYAAYSSNGGSFILLLDTNASGRQVYFRAGDDANAGFKDAAATGARLDMISNLVVDDSFNVIFTDNGNNAIRKLTRFVGVSQSQQVVTIAGGGAGLSNNTTGSSGYKEAKGTDALFKYCTWVDFDPISKTYVVADQGNNVVRRIAKNGQTSLICGSPTSKGATDGDGLTKATLSTPTVVIVDKNNGNIYIIEDNTYAIRLWNAKTKSVSTLGKLDASKLKGGTISGAIMDGTTFFITYGCKVVAWDPSKPTVTTLVAGGILDSGNFSDSCGTAVNGAANKAVFNNPAGLFLLGGSKKPSSRILVCDKDNNSIRQIYTDGTFTGINDNQSNSSTYSVISIYPNPAQGTLNVKIGRNDNSTKSLLITDVQGRVVFQTNGLTNGLNTITLPELQSGVYFTSVFTQGGGLIQSNKLFISK